jgi:hypothetical protein
MIANVLPESRSVTISRLLVINRTTDDKRVYRYLSGETSYKPTSRPRSCEFGLDLSSGLPVIQTQWDKNSYKQAQIVAVGSLREKHQGLSI